MIEDLLSNKLTEICFYEDGIDGDFPIYLITYSPDPSRLPDCDFNIQHRTNINLLSEYLKYCKTGLFCVESTQMGNPHYHGWYQVDDSKELYRISMIKVMQKLGNVKITKPQHSDAYKINCFTQKSNFLYYYKKDLVDAMLNIEVNPISEESYKESYDEVDSHFFTIDISKKKVKSMADVISDRKFYQQFYRDST